MGRRQGGNNGDSAGAKKNNIVKEQQTFVYIDCIVITYINCFNLLKKIIKQIPALIGGYFFLSSSEKASKIVFKAFYIYGNMFTLI